MAFEARLGREFVVWAMGRNRRRQATVARPVLRTVEGEVSFEPVVFDDSPGGSTFPGFSSGTRTSATSAIRWLP